MPSDSDTTRESTASADESPTSRDPLVTPPPTPIRVLLVDDHKILREGLATMLSVEPDLQVVGQAADGLEAVEAAGMLDPHVIVMDISMPRMNGIEATRQISREHPQICIIGLSMHEKEDMAAAMRDAGAADYMIKDGPIGALVGAIRKHATSRQ